MVKKKRIRLKKKANKIIFTIILIVSIILIIYNTYKIFFITNQKNETNNLILELEDNFKKTKKTIIEDGKKEQEEILTYYDILKLKIKNNDTIGWLEVESTEISYPLVQTTNNNYYLRHSFDKSNNINGWVFMDYKNNNELLDNNTIIYAHNTIFKSLRKRYDNKNSSSFKINIYNEDTKFVYEVFSQYLTIPESIELLDKDLKGNILEKMLSLSDLNFKINVTKEDKILTLATCYHDNSKRLITHAKLINKVAL